MAARCVPRRCRARPARAPLPLVVGAARSTLASPSSGGFVQAAVDAYARTGHRPAWLSDELLAVLETRGRLVGLVYLLPGRGDTLRINGRARLTTDPELLDRMLVRGSRPLLALVVEVEEVFHHCAKAFLRSELWDPASWRPVHCWSVQAYAAGSNVRDRSCTPNG